jgi:hypothetical protein
MIDDASLDGKHEDERVGYLDLRAQFAGLWAACRSLQQQQEGETGKEGDTEKLAVNSLKGKRDAAQASLDAQQSTLKKAMQASENLKQKLEQVQNAKGQRNCDVISKRRKKAEVADSTSLQERGHITTF